MPSSKEIAVEAKRYELLENDEWRVHPEFLDYLGNRAGEIYSLKSFAILKGQLKKSGYIAMYLTKNRENTYITKHRFIYECFNGLITDAEELTHVNIDEADNRLENIKLLTAEMEIGREWDPTEWRQHPLLTKYAANSAGQIKTVITNKILTAKPNDAGYVVHQLLDDFGKSRMSQSHRIIYECHFGLLDKGLEVDHIKSGKSDNRIENLTALKQRAHAKKTRRDNPQISIKRAVTVSKPVYRYKLNAVGNETDKEEFASGKIAVEKLGDTFSRHGIQDSIRLRHRHAGFYWKYVETVNLEDEVWKTIQVEDMTLAVSNLGRIKTSYGTTIGNDNQYGYRRIGFGAKHFQVHDLVCRAFHGNPPLNMLKPTPDHINGKRDDNRSENLRWASKHTQGENRITTKKIEAYILLTGELLKEFNSSCDAHRQWGTDSSSIIKICKGQSVRKSAGRYNGQKIGWRYVDVD